MREGMRAAFDEVNKAAGVRVTRLSSSPSMRATSQPRSTAATILEKVGSEQPNHPGVAHYPSTAMIRRGWPIKGLVAARADAGLAPDMPHALHIPSRIFTPRGRGVSWRYPIVRASLRKMG
jgi:hypothetical protein